ncbi:CBF-domain-containing protein, partial [Aureobasidium melanogenum]
MGFARKRSADEARAGGSRPERTFPKKEYPKKEYSKKDGGEQKAKKTPLIFEPRPDWYATALPELPVSTSAQPPAQRLVDEIYDYAYNLLESENTNYAANNNSASSSHKFLSTIMASGTLEDKISALTLLVQESPLHNTKAFETLLGLARKKSRNQALMAVAAIKDLLGQGDVLPGDRKLRAFTK